MPPPSLEPAESHAAASRYLLCHVGWAGIWAAASMVWLFHAEASPEVGVWLQRLMVLAGLGLLGAAGLQALWQGPWRQWTWRAVAMAAAAHVAGLCVGLALSVRWAAG